MIWINLTSKIYLPYYWEHVHCKFHQDVYKHEKYLLKIVVNATLINIEKLNMIYMIGILTNFARAVIHVCCIGWNYIIVFIIPTIINSNSTYVAFHLKSTSDRILDYEINLQMLSEESCFIKSFSDADEVSTIISKVTIKKVWSIMQIIQSENRGYILIRFPYLHV